MSIRDYLSRVLFITVVCGLVVAGYYSWSATRLERLHHEATGNSLILREVEQIGEQLDLLLIAADLSIAAGETYTAQLARDLIPRLRNRLSDMLAGGAVPGGRDDLRRMSILLLELDGQLKMQEVVTRGYWAGEQASLLENFDAASGELVMLYEQLQAGVSLHTEQQKELLARYRDHLPQYQLLVVSVYLLVSALIVLWALRRIAWPLEALSAATNDATSKGTVFKPPEAPVKEIWTLGTQIFRLVSRLEHLVDERTGALEAKTISLEREINDRIATQQSLERARLVAEQSSRVKTEFLSVMSHELRTPMNAVIGALTLLRDSGINSTQGSYVKIADESGRALLALLGDVLDLSRIESEGVALKEEPLSVTALVDTTLEMMQGQATDKGLRIGAQIEPGLADSWLGDFDRLRQVLVNLVNNAIKFTEQGSVEIGVSRVNAESGQKLLRFAVTDTGIGVPEDVQQSIFDRFSQLDSSLARQHSGVGLGLSICRHLAHAMGGECGVESRSGEGSTFWFTAALVVGEEAVVEQAARRLAPPGHTGSVDPEPAPAAVDMARVLIVEDSEVNQLIASAIIGNAGHHVAIADSGEAALERLGREDYDVVLMDVQMPGMDGLETARRIRTMPGATAETHIIAFSANVLESTIDQCRVAGMDDFVSKPIVAKEVLGKIARVRQRAY